MSVIASREGDLFQPRAYEREDEFERDVVAMADRLFGPSTIYIDVKRRLVGKGIATIPDGYVVDMTQAARPKLFVVENEIVKHDAFRHIGVQLLKFVTSFEEAQYTLRNMLMAAIHDNNDQLDRLQQGCEKSDTRNIDAYLDEAVYGPFRGLVLIDEALPELHHLLEKINANISVLEFRRYISESGKQFFEFDTLYDEYDDTVVETSHRESTRAPTADERAQRRARRARADTVVVPAREEGFRRVFLGQDRWYAIRIGAAMKDRIRYIAAYQVSPVSAVTHLAEVQDIRPYEDSGKYMLLFKSPATEIGPIKLRDGDYAPQGPVYVERDVLLQSSYLEDALR